MTEVLLPPAKQARHLIRIGCDALQAAERFDLVALDGDRFGRVALSIPDGSTGLMTVAMVMPRGLFAAPPAECEVYVGRANTLTPGDLWQATTVDDLVHHHMLRSSAPRGTRLPQFHLGRPVDGFDGDKIPSDPYLALDQDPVNISEQYAPDTEPVMDIARRVFHSAGVVLGHIPPEHRGRQPVMWATHSPITELR